MLQAFRVTTVTATPGSVGSTIRYSIQSRVDGSHVRFTINANTGVIEFTGILDREDQSTWIIVVEVEITNTRFVKLFILIHYRLWI